MKIRSWVQSGRVQSGRVQSGPSQIGCVLSGYVLSACAFAAFAIGCGKTQAPNGGAAPDASSRVYQSSAPTSASSSTSSASNPSTPSNSSPNAKDGVGSNPAPSESPGGTRAGSASQAEPGAAAPEPLSLANEPPASFKGANKETIDGAVGLGCEARSASGFLELICRKKNGNGGHPVRAELAAPTGEVRADGEPRIAVDARPSAAAAATASDTAAESSADPADVVQADAHGELRLVLPFRDGAAKDVTLIWSDTKYVLHVRDTSAKLEWAFATLALRRACAALGDESRARVSAAQKADAENRVLPSEVAKLPRFATCIQAGHGSWALGLKSIAGTGEGAERKLSAALDIVHVSGTGQRKASALGTFEFAPAGLELPALQAYDYDDDGNTEAIVSYELRARPASAALPEISPIWSVSETGVAPYAKAPKISAAGLAVEQLEFDMRPDLGEYGPFVAWLGSGCGLKDCPARLTGPKLFWHSLPDGGFSNSDASAKAALKRACPKAPTSVVVEVGGRLNALQTAKALACARAWGVVAETLEVELTAKASLLCVEAANCPVSEAFHAWAKADLPVSLP